MLAHALSVRLFESSTGYDGWNEEITFSCKKGGRPDVVIREMVLLGVIVSDQSQNARATRIGR